jgi:hypothetical protein
LRIAKLIAAIVVLLALAALVYFSRGSFERAISPEFPDSAAIAAAVESAYVRIQPLGVDRSSLDMDGRRLRYDYVRLSRARSLLRANLELTRAVEKAGGGVLYGIESYDERKRKRFLTLGISSNDSLMCEVRLETRIR